MGVLTTAYAIPPDMMRRIQRNHDLAEKIFDAAEGWEFASYGFGKAWEETISIIGMCYAKTRNRLASYKCWDYPDYDIWTVTPSAVKIAADDLAPATFASLKKWGLKGGATDYYGEPIPEALYSYYVGDIAGLKKFLRATADAGQYLLFATG